ncbi:hypothetical protein ES708_06344 [subsurface metagenome]
MQLFRVVKKLRGSERGMALIETLVALAILGLVAVAFINGLATVAKATYITDVRTTAESLTRSGVEYLKSQSYINYADPGHGEYLSITPPAGYNIEITVVPIDPVTKLPLPSVQDDGLQKITVAIIHKGKTVISIEDYKVER